MPLLQALLTLFLLLLHQSHVLSLTVRNWAGIRQGGITNPMSLLYCRGNPLLANPTSNNQYKPLQPHLTLLLVLLNRPTTNLLLLPQDSYTLPLFTLPTPSNRVLLMAATPLTNRAVTTSRDMMATREMFRGTTSVSNMTATQKGLTSMRQGRTASKEEDGEGNSRRINGREEKEVGGAFILSTEEAGEEEANSTTAGTQTTAGGACGQEDDPLMTV